MASDSVISGTAVLIILFLMNLLLIAKGGERIAEVRARFILEALPGKQMALDASLNSGRKSLSSIEKAREDLVQESEFFSSMEGVFRFVRGDAILGIVILTVNILSIPFVLSFSKLTVSDLWIIILGDGLIGQVSAVLTSVGASTTITKVGKKKTIVSSLIKDIRKHAKIFSPAAFFMIALAMLPGVPFIPTLSTALLLLLTGWGLNRHRSVEECMHTEIHLSSTMVDEDETRRLYRWVSLKVYNDLGVCFPKVLRVYQGNTSEIVVKVFHLTLSLPSLEENTLYYKMCSLAHECVSARKIEEWLLQSEDQWGILADEVVPLKVSRDTLTLICKTLVKDGISMHLFPYVIEALACMPNTQLSVDCMVEHIRKHLGDRVGRSILRRNKKVHVVTVDPYVEQLMNCSYFEKNPSVCQKIVGELEDIFEKEWGKDFHKDIRAIVTGTESRIEMKRIIEHKFPDLPILSYDELPKDVEICSLGSVSDKVLL